ncbi:unnamed protein product, partial [Prorocentrum cordatum]
DEKEFYIKKSYREDTYQLLKHMKISGSLDKGTPRMERWQKRIKEEMDDWLALYRRQEMSVGRQSYYTLYSAINTMASHIVSYGHTPARAPQRLRHRVGAPDTTSALTVRNARTALNEGPVLNERSDVQQSRRHGARSVPGRRNDVGRQELFFGAGGHLCWAQPQQKRRIFGTCDWDVHYAGGCGPRCARQFFG